MEQKPIPDRSVKEINEVGKIAKFYGFKPIIAPNLEKEGLKEAFIRIYFEERMMASPQPNMFYCEKSHKASKLDCSIVSLGSSKSICECLSIETGITILNSLGYKNLEVEINSIGDKESMNEFQKKLAVFVRKNINSFSANLRQAVKKDLCAIFKEKKDECANFDTECPKSIDFLSETSRLHFKEVIEFLEVLDIPYQINPHLVGDLDIGSETVFAIKNDGEELAYGFRFNRLAKKLGCKKDLPATILDISAKLPSSAKTTADKAKKSLKKVKVKNTKPQFYLIQFGPEAKLKSFLILKELYKAGVNVVHTIAKDKLGGQMTTAENSEAPYIILIGQKEALDNSVVIRNTSTRAQETVLIGNLAARAKELAK